MNSEQVRRIEAEWIDVRTMNNIQLFTQSINVAQLALCGYPAAVIRLHTLRSEQDLRRGTSPRRPIA
jgi:hypothetical protein